MKLVDIKIKDQALKIQWIKRISDINCVLSRLAYFFLPKIGNIIWKCNLNVQDVDKIMPSNNFWKDVLKAWCSYNYNFPTKIEDIKNNVLWYNSNIKIQDCPIYYKQCADAGILHVRDIMKNDNTFLNYNEFLAKYGNVLDFVRYSGTIDAMPKTWKINIRNRYGMNEKSPDKFMQFVEKNQGTSFIYDALVDN